MCINRINRINLQYSHLCKSRRIRQKKSRLLCYQCYQCQKPVLVKSPTWRWIRAYSTVFAGDGHPFTIHLPFIYHSFTIHLPFIYHSFTIHLPFIYHSFTIHLPFIYHSFTIYLPFIYHLFTSFCCFFTRVHQHHQLIRVFLAAPRGPRGPILPPPARPLTCLAARLPLSPCGRAWRMHLRSPPFFVSGYRDTIVM